MYLEGSYANLGRGFIWTLVRYRMLDQHFGRGDRNLAVLRELKGFCFEDSKTRYFHGYTVMVMKV